MSSPSQFSLGCRYTTQMKLRVWGDDNKEEDETVMKQMIGPGQEGRRIYIGNLLARRLLPS